MGSIIEREIRTVDTMIDLYSLNHQGFEINNECIGLKEYVHERILNCPYQENKPVCRKCTIHCYELSMRSKIKKVMRYSGPRMIFHKPKLAIYHLIHTFRK